MTTPGMTTPGVTSSGPDEVGGSSAFVCPRCASQVAERFFGPCESCRKELAAAFTKEAVDVEVARFEPVMHVTPNQVATKD